MNEYFVPGAVPAPNSPGSSAVIRAEFTSIASAFDKLPVLAGSANEFVIVDPTGTRMIASGFVFAEFVTLDGVQTLTNKTLSWANNTWPGFGSAATKTAGTGADQVLLLAESAKLPALDASLLTNLTPSALGVVPVVNGGTGANNLGSAQVNLGINLKADTNNAVLTGAPTCPTPPVGNNSSRIANTQFVVETVVAVGGAVPSNSTPQMNGVAAAGVQPQVSRDDHVHPSDTSRAPASAATAAGTSFTPTGGVLADNMQAAIVELDTEKAPLASPAFTGVPTSTTPSTSDNSTRVATTAFTQSLLAQQPAGVQLSNSAPLVNGTVSPGTGVEASRYDHVHPSDTSRAPKDSPIFTGLVTSERYYNVAALDWGALRVGNVDVLKFGPSTADLMHRVMGGGTVNALVATISYPLPAYYSGLRIEVYISGANTSVTPTISVNGLAAKTIKKQGSAGKVALVLGDYNQFGPLVLEYDGVDFMLLNPLYSGAAGTVLQTYDMSGSGTNSASGSYVVLSNTSASIIPRSSNSIIRCSITFIMSHPTAPTNTPVYCSVGVSENGAGYVRVGDAAGLKSTNYSDAYMESTMVPAHLRFVYQNSDNNVKRFVVMGATGSVSAPVGASELQYSLTEIQK